MPCIVHWNQSHFIVVYKIKRKGSRSFIYVADPGLGKIRYTEDEFCRCWENTEEKGLKLGIALILETTSDFFKKEDDSYQKRSFLFLYQYLRPYKSFILQLFIGLIFGSLIQLVLPFLTQSIVDLGISEKNLNFIYVVLIAQLVLTLSNTSVDFIRGWILLHIGTRVNVSLISDFLSKLMHMPMKYFDVKMTGDILQRIGDHTRIQNYLTNSTLNVLFSFVNIFIFGVILALYSIVVFAIFFVGSCFYIFWVWLFMKKRAEIDNKNFAQQSANQSNIVQLITGMQEIKLCACERQKRVEYEKLKLSISRWENMYLLVSPIDGIVYFYWERNRYFAVNDMILSIIPYENENLIAKVNIQSSKINKIKAGQNMDIEFDKFNYKKYGILKAKIREVSFVHADNHLQIKISLPHNLITNRGKRIKFSNDMKAEVDIFIKSRRLGDVIFSPLLSLIEGKNSKNGQQEE